MSRRKGELSNAGIDRQWPHQVALKAPLGKRLPNILEFCRRCGAAHLYSRRWWEVRRSRRVGHYWFFLGTLAFRSRSLDSGLSN